jgi:signal transduction histidine kinase
VVIDTDLRVVTANDSFLQHFQVRREDVEGCLIFELSEGEWDIPGLRTALQKILPEQGSLKDFKVEHAFEKIGRRVLVFQAAQLDHAQRIILRIDDVTEERLASRLLEEINHTLEQRVKERTAEIQSRVQQLQQISLELANAGYSERHRLSAVLHDDIQQILVAVKMKASSRLDSPEKVMQVTSLLDQAIQGTRSLARELAPPVLSEQGLGPALNWLARWAEERYALHVEVETEASADPEDVGLRNFLFEIVKELLLNVVKHAGTDQVTVTLKRVDAELWLQVRDQGHGFDMKLAEQQNGYGSSGLISLRERLSLMGGRVELESQLGNGTSVTLIMPMEASLPRSSDQTSG